MQIIGSRGGLISAEGWMQRQGASRKFRDIFVIRGSLDSGTVIQRKRTHVSMLRDATSQERRKRPSETEAGSRGGTNSLLLNTIHRMQIVRRKSENSADAGEG